MEAIGVDLGSNKAVMAVVKKGGIDIVLNESSGRQTPVQVAYTDAERIAGDPVKFQIKKNFKNTVLFPTRLIGLNAECKEQLELEKRFLTHKIVETENKKIGFEVTQMGTKHTFTAEQCIAFYLVKLKKFFEQADIKSKDIVLSIPSYCSNVERQCLLDAAEIAGLNCLRVINESTAIALNYGFFRKKDLDAKEERVVAFVDMGHSKTTVTIASFVQGKTKIICHKSDRNLGARDFDWEIMQLIGGAFNEKYGVDPRENIRCRIRMLESIEKARKIISSVPDAVINIDYLLEEEDLNHVLKRDEFEAAIDPYLRRFNDLLKATIAESGLTCDQIHSVEMVGDATRTPIVLDITKQCFEKGELFRTLNSLETIGRGAALQSAMLSPLFSVSTFTVEEYNALPVSITYRFGQEGSPVTKELFKRGSMFPLTKTVTFDNKLGDMDLLIHYTAGSDILKGLPDQVAQYMIKSGKARQSEQPLGGSKVKFSFKVCNNIHQIPMLEASELTEEWYEEHKVAIKKAAPVAAPAPKITDPVKEEKKDEPAPATEQEYEIKQRKKSAVYPLAFETQAHALPPATRAMFHKVEAELYASDKTFLDWKAIRNSLESYAYEMRNGLQEYGNFEKHCEVKIRETFIGELNKCVEWLYADGEKATFKEYQECLAAFKVKGDPIKTRYIFYSTVPESIKFFDSIVKRISDRLAGLADEDMSEENRTAIISKTAFSTEVMDKLKAELASKAVHEDFSVSLAEIDSKIGLLKSETDAIFALPPPKKEEPMPEAEEVPAADAEMKEDSDDVKKEEPKQ